VSAIVKYLVAALAIVAPGTSIACQLELDGRWRSDHDMTMRFNREHVRLEPKTDAFLDALFGNMTLEFKAGELHLRMPDLEVPSNGAIVNFAGFEERKPYETLLCNDIEVVTRSPPQRADRVVATTYYFVAPDVFWVYAGSTDPMLPDLHIREYFRRIR